MGDNVVVVLEAAGGEVDLDEEGAVGFGGVVAVGAEAGGEVERFEVEVEAVFAFMADDEGEEAGGFAFVRWSPVGGGEFEGEVADVFDRLDFGDA